MIFLRRLQRCTFILSIYFLAGLPSSAFADSTLEANQLLQFFAAGCPSQGQWTQAAQNYANNLVLTMKTLATDPDCRTLNGALSSAQGLSTLLGSLSQDENQRQIISLKQQQQELLLMISKTNNTAEINNLVPQLQSVNLKISEYEGYATADQKYSNLNRQGQTLQTLVTGTQAVLQQATQNVTCLQKNPGILPALAGLSGAVSSVALTGGASLLVGASADIMNTVVSTIRNHRIARKINKMASSVTATAYQCVLESLSNQWCASQDALDIIILKGNAITQNNAASPIEQGVRLLDRDAVVFMNWLQTIQAGTDPTNQATATRQALVLDRNRLVQSARVNGLGIIAEAEKLFNTRSDNEERWNIQVQTMSNLVSSFTTSICTTTPCPTSPLADVFGTSAGEIAPWFLIGVPDAQIPRVQGTGLRQSLYAFSYSELVTFLNRQPPFKPDLKELQTRMLLWVGLARERVNSEMNTTLNLDPLRLVNDAATQNLDGTSAYLSLQNLIKFLRAQKPSMGAATGSFEFLYNDTIRRLEIIQSVIESVVNGTSLVQGDVSLAITKIYNAAVLDNGTGFVSGRLLWALRLSLNDMVTRSGGGASTSQAAILLATNDIVQQLESYTPGAYLNGSNLNRIARDIKKSQTIIENSLNVFTDEFGEGIQLSMQRLSKSALEKQEDAKGTNNQEIAEFCLELLSSPVWPKNVNPALCMGRSLESIFSTGPSSQPFSEQMMSAPYIQRVCTFRDYNRKNQLYQYFQGRNQR